MAERLKIRFPPREEISEVAEGLGIEATFQATLVEEVQRLATELDRATRLGIHPQEARRRAVSVSKDALKHLNA